jgi:hypothetical protein
VNGQVGTGKLRAVIPEFYEAVVHEVDAGKLNLYGRVSRLTKVLHYDRGRGRGGGHPNRT